MSNLDQLLLRVDGLELKFSLFSSFCSFGNLKDKRRKGKIREANRRQGKTRHARQYMTRQYKTPRRQGGLDNTRHQGGKRRV